MINKYQLIRDAEKYIIENSKEYIIENSFKTYIFDQGEGETLLFISPYPFIYAYQLLELSKKYRVIWYSWREAKNPSETISMEQRICDNLMIPKFLGLKDVNVVAVCHVGPVISAIAREPKYFKSLFLTNSFVYAPASLFDIISLKFVKFIPQESIVKRTAKKLAFDTEERKFIFERLMNIDNIKQIFITGIMPFLFADMRSDVCKLQLKSKVLLTGKDSYVGKKYMKYVYENLKNSNYNIIENLEGHFISILAPELFVNYLEEFLLESVETRSF